MSKQDIEKELKGKGEFVQINYIERFIKKDLPLEIKKFSYLKLAEIYEGKGMFSNAAKSFESAAALSIAFSEKIRNFMKATELYIKSGLFDTADYSMKRAIAEANSREKRDIILSVKNMYRNQAEAYEREKRRNNAVRIYEKLLEMDISEDERREIKKRLLGLYEKLGKLREYYALIRKQES